MYVRMRLVGVCEIDFFNGIFMRQNMNNMCITMSCLRYGDLRMVVFLVVYILGLKICHKIYNENVITKILNIICS